MDYFGDVSGHFKGLLNGNCEVVVVGVVAGDRVSAGRCAKRSVRQITDISEAKWNDLFDVQKRRFFECFAENEHIEFGYATFTLKQLQSMENYHLLYDNVNFPPAWDLALTGYAYGEILFEMGIRDEHHSTFTFDRVSTTTQSDDVVDHLTRFTSENLNVFYAGSKQEYGIQAADCLAGGIAEDIKQDTAWLEMLDPELVTNCNFTSLSLLENDLSNQRTGP